MSVSLCRCCDLEMNGNVGGGGPVSSPSDINCNSNSTTMVSDLSSPESQTQSQPFTPRVSTHTHTYTQACTQASTPSHTYTHLTTPLHLTTPYTTPHHGFMTDSVMQRGPFCSLIFPLPLSPSLVSSPGISYSKESCYVWEAF